MANVIPTFYFITTYINSSYLEGYTVCYMTYACSLLRNGMRRVTA